MSLLDRIANQVGQKYLSDLGSLSTIAKIGTDIAGAKAAAAVKAGKRALIGGISLQKARQLYKKCAGISYAKTNLWHISVMNLQSGQAPEVNLYATDVSYTVVPNGSDSVKVGSGFMAIPVGVEVRQVSITSLDDVGGSIKLWFRRLGEAYARPDGTFGYPLDYLVKVTITHGFISDEADNAGGALVNRYVMVPGTLEASLSRGEDNLERVTFTFLQWDSFSNLA